MGLRYIPVFLPSRYHWTHAAAPLGLIGVLVVVFEMGHVPGCDGGEGFATSANRIGKYAGLR